MQTTDVHTLRVRGPGHSAVERRAAWGPPLTAAWAIAPVVGVPVSVLLLPRYLQRSYSRCSFVSTASMRLRVCSDNSNIALCASVIAWKRLRASCSSKSLKPAQSGRRFSTAVSGDVPAT